MTTEHEATTLPLVNNPVKKESSSALIKAVASKALPIGFARLALTISNLAIGIAFRKMPADEMAAGPLIVSMQMLMMGGAQGSLLATGMMVGELNGQQKFSKIGSVILQSLLLGTGIAALASILLSQAGPFLSSISNFDSEVTDNVQDYFNAYIPGIFPLLWHVTDKQFAMATKRPLIPLSFNVLYGGLTTFLGFALMKGWFSAALSGPTSFGLASTVAAYTVFALLRLYYKFSQQFNRYNLFSLKLQDGWNKIRELLIVGSKMGLQNMMDWGHMFILSMLLGSRGDQTLDASIPLIQWSMAITSFSLGFGQGIATQVSNKVGALKKQVSQPSTDDSKSHAKYNVTRMGSLAIALGFVAAWVVPLLMLVNSRGLASAFLSEKNATALPAPTPAPAQNHSLTLFQDTPTASNPNAIFTAAEGLIKIGSLGVLAEFMRNLATGLLKPYKEINFPTLISFSCMTLLGLGGSAIAMNTGGLSVENLFWIRNIATLASSLGILAKWKHFSLKNPDEMAAQINLNSRGKGCCC